MFQCIKMILDDILLKKRKVKEKEFEKFVAHTTGNLKNKEVNSYGN